jgi:hypothetical protein
MVDLDDWQVSVEVEPVEFMISTREDVDLQVKVTLIGELDAAFSLVLPVAFHKQGHDDMLCRYFLFLDVTSEALRTLSRQALLSGVDEQPQGASLSCCCLPSILPRCSPQFCSCFSSARHVTVAVDVADARGSRSSVAVAWAHIRGVG